jgi:hypothetical protein
MKKIIAALVLLFALSVPSMAADIQLTWDASTSIVDGYALFDKNFQKVYNYSIPSWEGTALTGVVTVPDDRMSAFVARAYQWGPYDLSGVRVKNWSDNSNEVVWTPTTTKPNPPRNLIVRILTAVVNFLGRLFS